MIPHSIKKGTLGRMSKVAVSIGAVLVATAIGAASARASSSYADSAPGALETVRPTVTSLSVNATREVVVTFDEPVAGADIPANYTLSGHAGTLAAAPDAAASSGGNAYTLTWSSGEMLGGGDVTVTVAGVQDLVGNPVSLAANTASAASVFDAPVPGTASPPATAAAAPIVVPFGGATDASSGIAFVELWSRFGDGSTPWTHTGLSVSSASGSFDFAPPGEPPANHGIYHFDLVAQDNAGNRSTEPSGTTGAGQGATTFDTHSGVRDWEAHNQ